jgi:hypothetical protein
MKNTKFVKDLLMIDAQLGSISAIASEKNIFLYFPHMGERYRLLRASGLKYENLL